MKYTVTTLLLLRRDNDVLLAMKKRGFGAGRWNGVGGKVEPGETIEEAMVRECQEEISVTPIQYEKIAVHDFILDSTTQQSWHMYVHTYSCSKWEGEPTESEEMAPQWFALSAIPYADMWPDDRYWMPQAFAGKKLKTLFAFDANDAVLSQEIHEVKTL